MKCFPSNGSWEIKHTRTVSVNISYAQKKAELSPGQKYMSIKNKNKKTRQPPHIFPCLSLLLSCNIAKNYNSQ